MVRGHSRSLLLLPKLQTAEITHEYGSHGKLQNSDNFLREFCKVTE